VVARKPFDALVRALRSPDAVAAAEAARLLGELGRRQAVRHLLRYVSTSRHYHKTLGFEALARIGDASACPALRRLVARPNVRDDWYWYGCRGVRAAAAVALLALGDDGGAAYLRELADKQDDVFYCWFGPAILRLPPATAAARELKARITVEALHDPGARRTRHTDPGVVTMKAETLGLLATPAACQALLDLMRFHSRYVRGQAVLSLLQASRAPEHLKAAEALADGDPTDFVRIKAALALARSGRPGRAAFIAQAAASLEDLFDRAVAIEALGLVGGKEHGPVVARQLREADPYVRQCALEALERIDPGAAGRAAQRLVKDKALRVQLQAAKVLAAREA